MDKNNLQKKEQNEKQKQSLNAFARYSGMAFQVAGAIIAGVLLGGWLDKKFDTTKSHAFTILLTIMGVFLGVYTTIKEVLKK